MRNLTLLLFVCLFSACSLKEVKPWEKKTLAEETMQYGGLNSEVQKFEAHVYYSKEASRGGSGVGGGGCGCN